MSDRSRFTPGEVPILTNGRITSVDWTLAPTCECGDYGPLDRDTGLCKRCWSVLSMVRRALAERFADYGKLTYGPKPPEPK